VGDCGGGVGDCGGEEGDCSGGGETPGVRVLVREGLVDPSVVIVGCVSWFNALGCSGTGRGGVGVTPTGCRDISGAGEGGGCGVPFLKVQRSIDYRCNVSYCFQGTMCTSVSCRHTCSCRVFHVRRRGGLSNILLDHQGYPY